MRIRFPDDFGIVRAAMRGLTLVALVATGCSADKSKEAASPGGAIRAEEVPADAAIVTGIDIGVKGGRIIMGTMGEIMTLNEPITSDAASSLVTGLMWSGLIGYDRYAQTDEPGLAKSWDYNEETREWTFHLREGLRWSDGEPITSDDVMFYIEIANHPAVPAQLMDYLQTDGVPFEFSAPDPLTFVAKIPAVDSFAFLNLGLIKPFPRHKYGEALKAGRFAEILGTDSKPEDVVGSGPFVLKQYLSGDRIVLSANPHYYKFDEEGQRLPYVDELVILIVPNANAMELRFQAGDMDYLESIQASNLVAIRDGAAAGDYTVLNTGLSLTNNYYWFNLNPGGTYLDERGERVHWRPERPGEEPPANIRSRDFQYYVDPVKRSWFENLEFRKACSMATNRDAIVRTILFGEGAPIYGPEVPSNKVWHNPDIAKFPYDLKKAAETLDAIGFIDRDGDGVREDPDGRPIRFTLITNKENNTREKIGVLLMEDLKRIGLDVTVQLLDFNNIITRLDSSYTYEACLLGMASGVPPHPAMGANNWLSSGRLHHWHPEQPAPATEWEAEIDRLYTSMKRTFDPDEQREIYFEMQRIYAENQPTIQLMAVNAHVAVSNRIGNIKPTPLRSNLTHNIEEHYLKPQSRR
jgi:peptide/nickel transport system substrate-binding protein